MVEKRDTELKKSTSEVESVNEKFQGVEQEKDSDKSGYKVMLKYDVRFEYGGQKYELKKGKIYTVSKDLREKLRQAGYLEVV